MGAHSSRGGDCLRAGEGWPFFYEREQRMTSAITWRKGYKGPRFGWSKTHSYAESGNKTLCGKSVPKDAIDYRCDSRYGEQCDRCRRIAEKSE